MGRPKSAMMGGANRLRVSSQSLKRAWRTSPIFQQGLEGAVSTRTRRMASAARNEMLARGLDEAVANASAEAIGKALYGKVDPKEGYEAGQLAFVGPAEQAAVDDLVKQVADTGEAVDEKTAQSLVMQAHRGADIALFGRMLAARPHFNVEAAVDVAHAITVHKAVAEDDFFTAVDDLQSRAEDDAAGAGAGFMGETGFGAGLYYLYLCINRRLLEDNLQGDTALADAAVRALVEAAAKVGPGGKRTSFGSHAYAQVVMAEKGAKLPRSLSSAFLKPVYGTDMLPSAVSRLTETAEAMDRAYGKTADDRYTLDVVGGQGTLAELLDFVTGAAAG
jgi:CRISPR system Cascade subunit CasC